MDNTITLLKQHGFKEQSRPQVANNKTYKKCTMYGDVECTVTRDYLHISTLRHSGRGIHYITVKHTDSNISSILSKTHTLDITKYVPRDKQGAARKSVVDFKRHKDCPTAGANYKLYEY